MSLPFLFDIESVLGSIGDFIALCFFWAIKGLFDIMDTFMDIIFQLAGLKDLGGGGNILSNFFSNTGSKGNNSIATLYFSICLVCVVLMFFLTVISIIKQDFFSEEGAKSHAPIFKRLVTGLLYFIAIPPIFIFAVEIVSGLMSALMQIDSFASLSSLSQTIFELSLTEPQWMKVQGVELAPIPHWSVMEAKDFKALTETYNFNWIIFLGVIGMSFYSLFMIAFGLVKRVFNLVVLYVLGPIAISQSVLDGGSKMKNWKNSVVKEFVSVFGTIVGLVIFFMFITEVVSDLELFSGNSNFAYLANSVVKAMFILVGFSVIKGGSSYITDAIGGQMYINDGAKAFNDAMDSVQNAKKAFTAPMKVAGKGLHMAKNAVTKPIKGINTGIESIKENGLGGALARRLPTLDAFRTDAQLERIKAERENIKKANQETRDATRKLSQNPNDTKLQKEQERLSRISNPTDMATYMKKQIQTYSANLSNSSDNTQGKITGSSFAGQGIESMLKDASKGDYNKAKYTNVKTDIENKANSQIGTLNNEIGVLSEDSEKLRKESNQLAKKINVLLEESNSISGKVDSSGKEYTEEELAANQKKIEENHKKIAANRSKMDVNQSQININQDKIELYKSQVETITQEKQTIISEINTVENKHKTISNLTEEHASLRSTIDNFKDNTAGRSEKINAATKADTALKNAKDVFE